MGRPLGLETRKEGVTFVGPCASAFILRFFLIKLDLTQNVKDI
jgi:hypothetical protein